MDSLTEIKGKLDALYDEYIKKGNNLSDGKTNEVVLLLAKMTGNPNSSTMAIAEQLSRFSYKICQMYFDTLTKATKSEISMVDDLIKDFLTTVDKSKQPHHFVKKFADTIVPIIKNYKDDAINSKVLPSLVVFIASYALNSDKFKEVFQSVINRTNGAIYLLDYTKNNKESLSAIWTVTNKIFPDLSKARYESFIVEWAKKYGFMKDDTTEVPTASEQTINIEEVIVSNETSVEDTKHEEVQTITDSNADSELTVSETTTVPEEKKKSVSVPSKTHEKEPASEAAAKKLYINLKRDMDKEQQSIITAFTDMITPIGKAFESIQGEISKSRELGAENVSLKEKVKDLERQLSEQKARFQEFNQSLMSAKTENDELKNQISSLKSQNFELDSKLNDAYSINSRESSLEAEKIRSELKNAFSCLYEDWLEYEFSDVSYENYESLQAIIKKIFRSLERNGIDFKENN